VIRLIICVLCWVLLSIPAALAGFPVLYITGRIDLLWKLALWSASTGCRLVGIRIRTVGREKLEDGRAYLFMSNHASNLDPPILVPLLGRRITIIAKQEVFRIPVFGHTMRAAGFISVNRSDRASAVESVRGAVSALHAGLGMLVFPEGTRSPDGRLLPFKKGPFHLALEAGVPVVPVTIQGSHEAWAKGSMKLHPGEVVVTFHAPIDPQHFGRKEDLLAAVRAAIQSALPEPPHEPVTADPASR
jgi:1-acyl-sn-glycerol-3-phosphate acyltransferase